uniref:Uncharacterized protein n=1 Tax=Chenopodium quinoa TaxID=63459 RepID=A0A803MZA7_CHEQI
MASKEPDEKCSNTKTGEETIALEKRRSRSRRVSFAETTAIHLFIRDEECDTPPDVEGSNNGLLHRSEKDNFFGPVSADFIKPGRLSDSAASDDNHDLTMDSTAFSMHFRSLARSDSGGEFKTPTAVRLPFGERTSGQMSSTTSGGDLMVLSDSQKRVSDSLLADKVNGSGNSDDMSIVEEYQRSYDYGKLPPELDVLLTEDGKDVGAVPLTSQVECSNFNKSVTEDAKSGLHQDGRGKDVGTVPLTSQVECSNSKKSCTEGAKSGSHQNGCEVLDLDNNEKVAHHISDGEKASDGANSAVHVNIDNGNDVILHGILAETSHNTSINMDDDDLFPAHFSDDHTKTPFLLTNVMPIDKDEEVRKGAVEANGNLSPPSRSQSILNHEQSIAGSVSSLLAKRRQIFRVSPNDKSNFILSENNLRDKGSKHVLSASSFEKGASRLQRLEAFPFFSASKAEGNPSRLPSESVHSSLTRNKVLKCGSNDVLVAVPVACLDKQFSIVAEDSGDLQSMCNTGMYNVRTTLGSAECASYTEAKDAELSSLYAASCTSFSVSPLALSKEKSVEPFVSTYNCTNETVVSTRSDYSMPEITFNDLKSHEETGRPNHFVFSPVTSVERKVSASPLYQGSLSKNLNLQAELSLSLDQDILVEADDFVSRSENHNSLLAERKKEAKRSSSKIKHFKIASQEMQNGESMYSNKASESKKLVIRSANLDTETISARALPEENMKSVFGSAPSSDNNLIELPIQVYENHKEEQSCSLLQKKPCLVDNAIVGVTVLTPRSYQRASEHDENDQPSQKSSDIFGSDNSSTLKRKLFDGAENDNDAIASLQRKPKLCKDQKHNEEDSKEFQSIGVDTTAKHWVDVLNSFCGMTKLMPLMIDSLDLAQISILNDILVHQEKMRSYELLHRDICSQKAFDSATFLQIKRLVDTKLLLYKLLYQKAKLQLMHHEQKRLSDRVCELNFRVEESKMLISSCQDSCISGRRDVEPVSCPIDLSKKSLVAAKIPLLRKDLEISERKIRNINKSYHAYIKAVKDQTCTETTVHVKNILKKRVECKSLQSEFQLCQVGNVKAMDKMPNILFDYCGIMSQRFIVKSISTYGLFISNVLNNVKISKMFRGMDASTAFSFVLRCESNLAYSGIKTIVQETQKSSSLLHNLLDVVEEVELAMVELRNLTNTRFSQPSGILSGVIEGLALMSEVGLRKLYDDKQLICCKINATVLACLDGKLDLQLCFTDFNNGARVALSIDITCLNRGIYPAQVLPYEVQGKAARRHGSFQLLLDNISSAVRGVRCGHMRIISLCRCFKFNFKMSDKIFPNTFVYPHRIGAFPSPPVYETSHLNWDFCVIGRFWDTQDAVDLDARGWVHLKGSLMAIQRLRGYSVPENMNLNLADMWVIVVGLPIRYSTPMVAASVLTHVGDITMEDELPNGFPIPRPRVKLLVDLSLPLIPGCYFPTYDNRATWVRFKYEGIFKSCKKCGFFGHGRSTCNKEQDEVTFHLESRFHKLHKGGAHVLFGSTDVPLFSNATRGISPTPKIWTIELWFGNHDEDDPLEYSGDSHPSDGDIYRPGNLDSPSLPPLPPRSLPGRSRLVLREFFVVKLMKSGAAI